MATPPNLDTKLASKSDKTLMLISVGILALLSIGLISISVLTFTHYKDFFTKLSPQKISQMLADQKRITATTVTKKNQTTQKDYGSDSTSSSSVTTTITQNGKTITTNTQTTNNSTSKGCQRYYIYIAEFKSAKCYTPEDYKLIKEAVTNYQAAKLDLVAAESLIKVMCTGDGFTKEYCDEGKADRERAKTSIAKYSQIIKNIMARGEDL